MGEEEVVTWEVGCVGVCGLVRHDGEELEGEERDVHREAEDVQPRGELVGVLRVRLHREEQVLAVWELPLEEALGKPRPFPWVGKVQNRPTRPIIFDKHVHLGAGESPEPRPQRGALHKLAVATHRERFVEVVLHARVDDHQDPPEPDPGPAQQPHIVASGVHQKAKTCRHEPDGAPGRNRHFDDLEQEIDERLLQVFRVVERGR
mmetsp:Transcript_64823/g.146243  ORF Transcript_64823/g.146243 Transcript_64823/m.146243 type:complete len:205 (-) Transcript_64823:695-1309(-)